MKNSNLAFILGCIAALILGGHASNISDVNHVGSVIRFKADVTYLQYNQCVESAKFVKLNGIEWTIRLCKTPTEAPSQTSFVDVGLVSKVRGFAAQWHCNAQASFKMIGNLNKVVLKELPKNRFSHEIQKHFVHKFIEWKEFSTFYVNGNQTTIEVAISTNLPNNNQLSDVDVTKARIHVMLNNVSRLTTNLSPEIVVRGIRWRIVTERVGNIVGSNGALAIYLEAVEEDFGKSSSYKVSAVFKLVSYDANKQPTIVNIDELYHWGVPRRGIANFLRWDLFIDTARKHILGDKANLLVEFSVEEPKSLWDIQGALSL